MWTLVIIVIMSSVQGGSGTSSSIHTVGNFSSQQKCDAAAKAVAHAGVSNRFCCIITFLLRGKISHRMNATAGAATALDGRHNHYDDKRPHCTLPARKSSTSR